MTWFFIGLSAPFLWVLVNIFGCFLVSKYSIGKGCSGGLVLFSSLIGIVVTVIIGLTAMTKYQIAKCLIMFFLTIITPFQILAQKNEIIKNKGGFYNTTEWSMDAQPIMIPQIWIYFKDVYLETRYNYEDINTASIYIGKVYGNDDKVNFEIIPVVGIVYGKTKGVSVGLNFDLQYKMFSTFTQSQNTIDFNDINKSFSWVWTGFKIDILKYFGVGGAIQYYQPNKGESISRISPMICIQYKSFVIEGYSYNYWENTTIYAIGIEYQIE